jgi:hypothetical protein
MYVNKKFRKQNGHFHLFRNTYNLLSGPVEFSARMDLEITSFISSYGLFTVLTDFYVVVKQS